MDIRVFKEDFHTTDYLSTKGQARHRSIPKKKKKSILQTQKLRFNLELPSSSLI